MAWLEDFRKKREERRVDSLEKKRIRSEKVSDRRTFRLDKIHAIKDKFYAVAIVAYLVIFKGGFSFGGGSGILEKIKGFF